MIIRRLLLLLLLTVFATTSSNPACYYQFHEKSSHNPKGVFSSPGYPKYSFDGATCFYKIIASPGKRVRLTFGDFALRGTPPICKYAYVDVYGEVWDPDKDLLEQTNNGRLCGRNEHLPKLIVSRKEELWLWFFTAPANRSTLLERNYRGFIANYSFVDGSIYQVGQLIESAPSGCQYEINSDMLKTGTMMTQNYPGMYFDKQNCKWVLKGRPDQRIRVIFDDFDVFPGGDHCPFDSLSLYDAVNATTPMSLLCGSLRQPEYFSTSNYMMLQFQAGKSGRQLEPAPNRRYWEATDDFTLERRGFKARFVFSNKFANLSFVGNEAEHIAGTQCDSVLFSTGLNSGEIVSPNFPNPIPPGLICKYYLNGLENSQFLEKVQIAFKPLVDIRKPDTDCMNGSIRLLLRGQSVKGTADLKLCGPLTQRVFTTKGSSHLILILNTSKSAQPYPGFKANYRFMTDYGISNGVQQGEETCHFVYQSTGTTGQHGTFQSPRHPALYPRNTHCIYDIVAKEGEQIRLTFMVFSVGQATGTSCPNDIVKVVEFEAYHPTPLLQSKPRLIICGDSEPGPLTSNLKAAGLRVELTTSATERKRGFLIRYDFLKRKKLEGQRKRCEQTIQSAGGIVVSPNYPTQYPQNMECTWKLRTSNPASRIMLRFDRFAMEGEAREASAADRALGIHGLHYSCSRAVLQLSGFGTRKQLCGSRKPSIMVSNQSDIQLRFISSGQAAGASGFRIIWSELLTASPDGTCPGFLCKRSRLCIPNSLLCNGHTNCGETCSAESKIICSGLSFPDESDEHRETCGQRKTDANLLHIVLAIVVALVLLISILLIVVVYRKHQASHRRKRVRSAVAERPTFYSNAMVASGSPSRHLLQEPSYNGSTAGFSNDRFEYANASRRSRSHNKLLLDKHQMVSAV